jgi:hypothetical protein
MSERRTCAILDRETLRRIIEIYERDGLQPAAAFVRIPNREGGAPFAEKPGLHSGWNQADNQSILFADESPYSSNPIAFQAQ